jgi:hypothetical protein
MAIEFDPSADNAAIGLEIAELALNLTTGDLLIPPKIIRGAEAVAQRVRVRFRWFLGEWFLDERLGVPYYSDILVKNPDPILISFIFRRVLLSPRLSSAKIWAYPVPKSHFSTTYPWTSRG